MVSGVLMSYIGPPGPHPQVVFLDSNPLQLQPQGLPSVSGRVSLPWLFLLNCREGEWILPVWSPFARFFVGVPKMCSSWCTHPGMHLWLLLFFLETLFGFMCFESWPYG